MATVAPIQPITGEITGEDALINFQTQKDAAKKLMIEFLNEKNLSLNNRSDFPKIGRKSLMELWAGYIHVNQKDRADNVGVAEVYFNAGVAEVEETCGVHFR